MTRDAANPSVRVVADGIGHGKVVVGETDVSEHVQGFRAVVHPGHPTQVTVDLTWSAVDVRGNAKLADEMAYVLRTLGWNKVAHLAMDLANVLEIEIPEELDYFAAWMHVLGEAKELKARMKGLEK